MMGRVRPLRRLPKRYVRRLPRRLAVPELSARGWPRADTEDVRSVAVPDPFRLEAYWLRVHGAEGPALSLFLRDDEILRVDCLPENPHVHYGLAEARHRRPMEGRVYAAPAGYDELIDRAVFELAHNVAYCTGLHRDRAVRTAPVDEAAFRVAADEVGRHLARPRRRPPGLMPSIDHLVVLPLLPPEQLDVLEALVAPGRVDTDPAGLATADVAVLDQDPDPSMAGHGRLAWVHLPHAGLDGAALGPLLERGITVTSGAGRSAEALAEHALGFLLALNGDHARYRRAQRWRVWGVQGQGERRALRGRTVLVVGTGHTGRAVAELCAALGMRVLGHRRRDQPVTGPFERVTSAERGETVDLLLPEADAVVLTASLNDGSRHLIGEAQLAALPRGAFLVNLGRGGLVDEAAMVSALRRGQLGARPPTWCPVSHWPSPARSGGRPTC